MLRAALAMPLVFAPTEAPVSPASRAPEALDTSDAVSRSIAILLSMQVSLDAQRTVPVPLSPEPTRLPCEWPYEPVFGVGWPISVGYRVAGTSIAASALLAARGPGIAGEERAAVLRALEFVIGKLAHASMGRGFAYGFDDRGWGHTFALAFLLEARAARIVPESERVFADYWVGMLVELIEANALPECGGWNYHRPQFGPASPATFMTAPTLQALFAASAQGEPVNADVVARALDTLEAGRLASGAFKYATDPAREDNEGSNSLVGSIARSPLCEATLRLAGRGSVERVRVAVLDFFAHWQYLEERRKRPGTHAPPFMIAPYYFYFAHRYAAQAIELLPADEREPLRERLRALFWRVREADGAWHERSFPCYGAFGTSMVLLALCEPLQPRPAGWPPAAKPETPPKPAATAQPAKTER